VSKALIVTVPADTVDVGFLGVWLYDAYDSRPFTITGTGPNGEPVEVRITKGEA
jgi:hypothetical protein